MSKRIIGFVFLIVAAAVIVAAMAYGRDMPLAKAGPEGPSHKRGSVVCPRCGCAIYLPKPDKRHACPGMPPADGQHMMPPAPNAGGAPCLEGNPMPPAHDKGVPNCGEGKTMPPAPQAGSAPSGEGKHMPPAPNGGHKGDGQPMPPAPNGGVPTPPPANQPK